MPKGTTEITYRRYWQSTWSRKLQHVLDRRRLIDRYMSSILESAGDAAAFGFKLMYGQVRRYDEIVGWCKDNDVKVIHLIRKNVLKALVSGKIAKKRGVYLSDQALSNVNIVLDTGSLVSELEERISQVRKYRQMFLFSEHIEVEYESFIDRRDSEIERVLDFLKVQILPLESRLVKTSPDSLSKLVVNYEQVRQHLSGTPYSALLD